MALQQVVETTVTGLGYDLVEIERSAGGLLRITIDPFDRIIELLRAGEPLRANMADAEPLSAAAPL